MSPYASLLPTVHEFYCTKLCDICRGLYLIPKLQAEVVRRYSVIRKVPLCTEIPINSLQQCISMVGRSNTRLTIEGIDCSRGGPSIAAADSRGRGGRNHSRWRTRYAQDSNCIKCTMQVLAKARSTNAQMESVFQAFQFVTQMMIVVTTVMKYNVVKVSCSQKGQANLRCVVSHQPLFPCGRVVIIHQCILQAQLPETPESQICRAQSLVNWRGRLQGQVGSYEKQQINLKSKEGLIFVCHVLHSMTYVQYDHNDVISCLQLI